MHCLCKILVALLRWLCCEFDWMPPKKPGPLKVKITMSTSYCLFDVLLPVIEAPHDVTKRVLEVESHLDDLLLGKQNIALSPDAISVIGLKALMGSDVKLSLVHVDGSGNVSAPAKLEFVAADTVAPPEPGKLGVIITGQEIVEDAEPVPPPEEPVV